MPYDPHLLASWSQFYEAILSAPPPAMQRMSGPACPPPFSVRPLLKPRLGNSVGGRFVVMRQ